MEERLIEVANKLDLVIDSMANVKPEDVMELDFSSTKLYGNDEQVKAFFTDYSKYFAEITNPKNTKTNPHFKSTYSPLDEVFNVVRPVLSKYGLAVMQIPKMNGTKVVIGNIMTHKAGAFMTFEGLELPSQQATAQGIGGTITYGRRYSLSAICGVSSEEDDDGNVATKPLGTTPPPPQNKPILKPPVKTTPPPKVEVENPELKKIIGEIAILANTKSTENKDAVVNAVKDNSGSANYNKITDVEVAKKVKLALETI